MARETRRRALPEAGADFRLNSMLFLLVPVAVLLAGSVVIFLINRFRQNSGVSWLIAIFEALIVWGWVISLNWQPHSLFAFSNLTFPLEFSLDATSWPYMMAVATLSLLVLLTAPSRKNNQLSPTIWGDYLLISAIGLFAVTSGNLWALIFCWMGFDLLEMALIQLNSKKGVFSESIFSTALVRLSGIFLASMSFAISSGMVGSESPLAALQPMRQGTLFIACALRMGIFPFQNDYLRRTGVRQGLQVTLRLMSILIVLPALLRINATLISDRVYGVLSLLAVITAVIGGIGWFLARKTLVGRDSLINVLAAFAYLSALRYQPQASIIWGTALVFVGAPIFLYSARHQVLNGLLVLVLALFAGIPFTPGAGGLNGLLLTPVSFPDLILLLAHLLVIAGYLFHIQEERPVDFQKQERWMRTVYPFGFWMCAAAYLFTAAMNWQFYRQTGVIWAAVVLLVGALFLRFGFRKEQLIRGGTPWMDWSRLFVRFFWRLMHRLISFRWLNAPAKWALSILSAIITFISNIFEGNSGILWEFMTLITLLLIAMTGSGA